MPFNKEWFVFTSKRISPEVEYKTTYYITLAVIAVVAFITHYLTPERIWVQVWNSEYGYYENELIDPSSAQIFASSLAFTFLEVVFYLLVPYTFRFVIKPRVKGSDIEEMRPHYDTINRNLHKDIILFMQIRLMVYGLTIISVLISLINPDDIFWRPDEVRVGSNFIAAFLIIVFLIPRYLEKLEVQRNYIPQRSLNTRDGDLITAFFFMALTYWINYLLVYVFLKVVIFNPLGL